MHAQPEAGTPAWTRRSLGTPRWEDDRRPPPWSQPDDPRGHLRLAVRRVARRLLPPRPAAAARARARRVTSHHDRGQRVLLLPPAPVELEEVGRGGARRLPLRRQGTALRDAHEEAGGRRSTAGHVPGVRSAVARLATRSDAVAAAAEPRLPPRPAGRLLRPAATAYDGGGGPRGGTPRRGQAQGAGRHDLAGRPAAAPRARGPAPVLPHARVLRAPARPRHRHGRRRLRRHRGRCSTRSRATSST